MEDVGAVLSSSRYRGIAALNEALIGTMQDQINDVVDTATGIYGNTTQASQESESDIELLLLLWLLSMQQTTSAYSMRFAMASMPVMQSVSDDVYRKIMLLLGISPNRVQLLLMSSRAREIAQSLRYVNQTTLDRLTETITTAAVQGGTMAGVIAYVKERARYIVTGRIPTISRTEVRRVSDVAAVSAYADSKVVSHISVVGCMAIEPNCPTYAGVPTCNIQNVPVKDALKLVFHPNHTGIMVPSAFYNEDGTAPQLTVTRGS